MLASPVSVTAVPTFTRAWDWTIGNSVDPTTLTVLPGETSPLGYEAVLDASATDSDWAVSGVVTITLAAGPSIVMDVAVDLGAGVAVDVTCSPSLPAPLVSAALSVVCTYGADLPNGDPRTATVAVLDAFGPPVFGTGEVTFGAPTTELDACVDVTDGNAVALGVACADAALPYTLAYSADAGPFSSPDECGDHVLTSTASFAGNDTGQSGSAATSTTVTVDCTAGAIEVEIDIMSGRINANSRGVIPVAILGSATFDVEDVDRTSLSFGLDEAAPAHKALGHLEDVNDDGFVDLVSHYRTQDTGLASGDTEACVVGATHDGQPLEGCDSVIVK